MASWRWQASSIVLCRADASAAHGVANQNLTESQSTTETDVTSGTQRAAVLNFERALNQPERHSANTHISMVHADWLSTSTILESEGNRHPSSACAPQQLSHRFLTGPVAAIIPSTDISHQAFDWLYADHPVSIFVSPYQEIILPHNFRPVNWGEWSAMR
eukprot:scaffold6235_cov134-Pinguiococcus_pyrenoidosus.AAC.1